jgi:hypothetical protein
MNSGRIHGVRIQQADPIRPELMDLFVAGIGEMINEGLDG